MAYDGSIKIDTKIDTEGFSNGVSKMKSIASTGAAAITSSLAAVAGGIIAGGTAATKIGSEFESGMSKVQAISGATGEDLEKLTEKAKEMGAKTKFTAYESSEAFKYMAMAGWKTTDMLDGIDGIMSLSAADGLDLATTSDIVTDAITAFGLKAKDSSHFADLLATTASNANTNVAMMGDTFKYVAPVAGSLNVSAEATAEAIGLMANSGVKASMAGTALRSILTRLSTNAGATKDKMGALEILTKRLGVEFYNTDGSVRNLNDILDESRKAWAGLSSEEATNYAKTIAGQYAMSGWLALMNSAPEDVDKVRSAIDDCDGSAENMANTMQDNLQGQITILKSALEGLAIEIYEGMSTPLKDAAVEAQNYVNRLTGAFKDGGLSGMIAEAGNIFGELAVKAAEKAPQMVETAIKFIQAFVSGIVANSGKLAAAAKQIINTLGDNFVKLLPSEVQKPVKETISTLKKSFESGGLRSAINTVGNIFKNLGKVITNVAKVVLPPLAKAVDFVGANFKTLLPIITSILAAYKTYQIIATVTALFKAHTAAVTAESLAEAASLGTITLKQIAVGVLTGEITLATAAQYAWNLAMSMNPIGAIITAVAALVVGIGALVMTMGNADDGTNELMEAQEKLAETNKTLGDSYVEIGDKFSDFMNEIDNSDSILDNFNENILISDDERQALADNMDSVQGEITEICRSAAEERRELTGGEIQRLDELFQKMHELSERELAIEERKQGVVTSQAQALNSAAGISLEEYQQRSGKLAKSAEETRQNVIDKAYEQYTEEVALLDLRLETDADYSKREHDADVQAAEKRYQDAISAANKEAGDTLSILVNGYSDRADVLSDYTKKLATLNSEEEAESKKHSDNLNQIDSEYGRKLGDLKYKNLNNTELIFERDKILKEKQEAVNKEKTRNIEEINRIHNDKSKLMGDENYQNQLAAFGDLEMLYETYTGKTGDQATNIANAFKGAFDTLPDDTKDRFKESVQGAIDGCEEKRDSLFFKATQLANGFVGIFRRIFDNHSPSKRFRKLFRQNLEGAELGNDDEKINLYKQADDIGETYTKRMRLSLDKGELISKMRDGIDRGRAFVAQALTAKVIHRVNIDSDNNNRKFILKGDVHTQLNVDGREMGYALTPYVSEQIAWEGQ